jgi:hypothetical protein
MAVRAMIVAFCVVTPRDVVTDVSAERIAFVFKQMYQIYL